MLKVGLTGSIAVGKSFVCDIFRELGAFVLDADQTAREVVALNTKGLKAIVENFGKEILQANGELDRAKLGAIVFADERKRQLLNSIVHPLVIERQNDWLRKCESENADAICIIEAALMIESGGYKRFDKIIVVWCEPAIQLERLRLRNNLSSEEAIRRINSQMPQEEKKCYADFLIDTSKGFEAARQHTLEVFEQLKLLI
ncbi:MAG: dephospho-CoA kinase [Acidobacteria bacterium]|nr:dephospho-CoA kinase [Acidobacteriota bacterium]MCA1637440.1 dephospho-CoA kinase [Acidobacteriota bacterium]